jgi:hypothetical protein
MRGILRNIEESRFLRVDKRYKSPEISTRPCG